MNKVLIIKRVSALCGLLGGLNLILAGQPETGGAIIAASLSSANLGQ